MSCAMPTVKQPGMIHVWGNFSSEALGLLPVLSKNTSLNKERDQEHPLRATSFSNPDTVCSLSQRSKYRK